MPAAPALSLLRDLPMRLAAMVVEETEVLADQERLPNNPVESDRRVRRIATISRAATAIIKFEELCERPRRPKDEDTMDDPADSDARDPAELLQRYVELKARLDRVFARIDARAAERAGVGSGHDVAAEALVAGGRQRASG